MSSEPLVEEVGDLIDGSINRVAQAVQDHPDHLPVQIGWTKREEEGREGTLTESKISSRTIAPELSTSKSLKAQPTSSWNLDDYNEEEDYDYDVDDDDYDEEDHDDYVYDDDEEEEDDRHN